jgi:hypothetical protein
MLLPIIGRPPDSAGERPCDPSYPRDQGLASVRIVSRKGRFSCRAQRLGVSHRRATEGMPGPTGGHVAVSLQGTPSGWCPETMAGVYRKVGIDEVAERR